MFGLTSQFRRAAISIPANIAEGFARRGRKDKMRYFNVSQGSLEECRYYLILAQDLGSADTEKLLGQIDEVSRMNNAYIRAIKSERWTRLSGFFWLLASRSWLLHS